jgi:D-threo-aldose 1-dehydrogenase
MALSFSVPGIGLGTAPMGSMAAEFGLTVSDADAHATILHAYERGVRFFDTAPLYGNGLSETRLGNALHGLPREEMILATKVGWLPNTLGGPSTDGTRIYTREAVLRSVDESLKRLRTTYLDIVHVHDPDLGDFRKQVLDEAFPVLNDLKGQGVIRAVGSGMNQWEMLADWADNAEVDCFLLAGRYSLLEQGPLEKFFPVMLRKKIAIILGGVFNSGILATGTGGNGARYQYGPAPDAVIRKTRQLEEICARYEVPLRAAALQFAAAHPVVVSLVLGMVKPAEVDDNLSMLAVPIPSAFWQELRVENLIDLGAPTPS